MVLGTDPPHTPKPPPGPGSAAAAPEPLTGTAAAARCWGLEAAAPRPGAETLGPRSGRLQAAGQEQSCSQHGSAARPAGSWAPGHRAPVLPRSCPAPAVSLGAVPPALCRSIPGLLLGGESKSILGHCRPVERKCPRPARPRWFQGRAAVAPGGCRSRLWQGAVLVCLAPSWGL